MEDAMIGYRGGESSGEGFSQKEVLAAWREENKQ
jgi:hypothetical protein